MPVAIRLAGFARMLRERPFLCVVPVLAFVVFNIDGGSGALAFILAFPMAFLLSKLSPTPAAQAQRDPLTGLGNRGDAVAALDSGLGSTGRGRSSAAALVIEIDRIKHIEAAHGRSGLERILRITADRLRLAMRDADLTARIEGPTFAVVLAAPQGLDLEAALQVAGRIQRTLAEPIALGEFTLHPTVCIGLALPERLEHPTGEALLQAATVALVEAQRGGPAAIRSFSEAMRIRVDARGGLAQEVASALERGEIAGFFQPQVSSSTGAITGFETLARWMHPARGLIPPAEFLPAVEQAGLMPRLGDVMLKCALTALREWEAHGIHIPRVGVNFSSTELCNPGLLDHIGWELDRFDLSPDRLVVEVLETVVASRSDDVVIRNLAGLAQIGCCLDLDDFGTGHASITSIRRFSIERIKIDRSFVTRIDEDEEQQRMVAAILTMAERLGLDTLAEGVETEGERAKLIELGCGHLQGFGIARPMPFAETLEWIRSWEKQNRSPTSARQLRLV
ncbi:GGDEF domain-containing protein [Rubellimicrobium rubrum]|uniref:GGDEF domain-containing protein n=1 Tax=Rubellimicrobium rubrum TaxID=2585369 RepID=A0A5C4MPV1_9RHOB|nr:bifunctional diguanylate cyclase/phosphodiesterase [Rubellimicrobium rubrum]TNC46591.1 GGDEF domain-containing protein [Rubellimicrobium rubrum]